MLLHRHALEKSPAYTAFVARLGVVMLVGYCFPLLVTNAASFGNAREECRARAAALFEANWPEANVADEAEFDVYYTQ